MKVQITFEGCCWAYGPSMLFAQGWEVGRCSEPKHSPIVQSSSASPAWQMCSCPQGSKMERRWWGGNWIYLCSFCQSDWILKHLSSKHHNHLSCYSSPPASIKFNFVNELFTRGKEKVILIVGETCFHVSGLDTALRPHGVNLSHW